MANTRTTKKNANKETTKISTAAPVIEKAAIVEEVKAESVPAVTEYIAPVVEAPVVTKAPAAEPVKEKKVAPKKKATPAKSEGVKRMMYSFFRAMARTTLFPISPNFAMLHTRTALANT